MSKQRSQKPKVENVSNTTDERSIMTPPTEGTDPDSLPFLEWSDQDLNFEKWDSPSAKVPNQTKFEDPQEVHLPPSIAVHEWKRCSEVFPDVNFTVVVAKPSYPDLITPNYHLLQSEFYRSFISSIETLLYIGSSKQFPEEYGSSGYSAPTDRPWRPWYHIYSNSKATKGQDYTPLYNPSGKYAVRLYWLGCWRKIYVDDFIPVDKIDTVLLPSLYIPDTKAELDFIASKTGKMSKEKSKGGSHPKKEIVELWPFLLCKALLKIGSLSWSNIHELNDFDIINCLTGWVPQRIKTKDISPSDLWDIFMAYGERFEWVEAKEESTKKSGSSKSKSREKVKSEATKKGTKGAKIALPLGIENMQPGDRYIVASCDNFSTTVELTKPFQNRNIGVFVSQVRTIPLIKPPPRPELQIWQTFRYEEWAVQQGIIPPDITKLNIKSLKIVDPFKRIYNNNQEIDDAEIKTQATADTENIDKKSEKSSKSSARKVADTKTQKHHLKPDPSMWTDFEEIKECINHVTIYFQPRVFKAKTKISDINFTHKTTDFKNIVYSMDLKEARNEPIYVFMDSIDYKFLLMNLAQIGNCEQLEKHGDDKASEKGSLQHEFWECPDICMDILLKKTEAKDDTIKSVSQLSAKSVMIYNFNTKPIHFVLEEYFWNKNESGHMAGMVQTIGNKSFILDLKPGRKAFRIWISTYCSYVLQIFSDTPINIGSLEEFIIACSAESQLLTNLCYEFSSCYGKLVQSFGRPDFSLSLRNFYHCYKPFENLSKKDLVNVHKALFEEFCKVINNHNSSPGALECIQLLFLQLKTFDYINPYLEIPHCSPSQLITNNQVNYAKRMQRAAVKIQAFFKGVYIRLIMKKRDESHKQYYGIFETLKKVYSEIFSSEKRLTYCPNLFRNFFERKDMESLREKFEIYKDMDSVFSLNVFSNSILVHEAGWTPICRYEFHVNSIEPITIKINLFCNLRIYYVKVFNNDTEREVRRYTNNVVVEEYESNVHGYTILCHGWLEENAKLNWKLILTKKKISRNGLLIIPHIPIETISLRDSYMPNFDNIICRYIIKVGSDTLLTAHLRTSYHRVKLNLKLTDKNGKTIHEINGVGSALLPVLHLHCYDDYGITSSSQKSSKKRLTVLSGMSEITYSKLNKKYGSSDSTRSSLKKASLTGDSSDSVTKKHRRKSSSEGPESEDDVSYRSHQSERSQDSSGKPLPTRRNKGRQSEVSENDSISERSSRRSSLKPKSIEKLNSRSLTLGSRKNSTRQSSLNKVLENSQTEYILEGKVLNDSWPLTGEEWQRVQRLKEKSYLNLLEERKSINMRKSLTVKKPEEPYWVLDMIHASGDSLELERDCSKNERRKQVKMNWFSNPERYKKGLELREAFLQENLVPNRNVISDKGKVRSNSHKDFAEKIVEEPSFKEFMITPIENVDEDTCYTKCIDDYAIDETTVEQTLKRHRCDEQATRDDTQELLENQIINFELLSQWFSEIRNDSVEMMCDAVLLEKEYVKKVLESTKGKGDKKRHEKKKKKSA